MRGRYVPIQSARVAVKTRIEAARTARVKNNLFRNVRWGPGCAIFPSSNPNSLPEKIIGIIYGKSMDL
jgi:hypothetical protein